jgi:aspartokinase-like uncharacterized kinase
LLARAGAFARVADTLGAVTGRGILVVPGGGPFADTVRALSRRIALDADTAHWMAILGMEQYAHALASRIAGATLVEGEGDIAAALADGRVPVLAPFRWLRAVDPLPHSWDVTSDSIAAWIAGVVGARRLVLIKPGAGEPMRLVDPYFQRALRPGIEHHVLAVDDVAELGLLLDERGARPPVAPPERR